MMENNIIYKLKKDTWKGTLLPIESKRKNLRNHLYIV